MATKQHDEVEERPDYEEDFEESFEQLEGSNEQDPVNFWETKQKELVTSVVDYNLQTLSDLITNKSIDLDPKYQRRFRWDEPSIKAD